MPQLDRSDSAPAAQPSPAPAAACVQVGGHNRLSSEQLLGERRELRIEHHGSEYVLRATRNGKLILTK